MPQRAVDSTTAEDGNRAVRSRTHAAGGNAESQAHFWTILVAFIGNGLQAGVFTVLIADLAAALHLSGSTLGTALAVLSGTSAVAVLVSGRIADRTGRRPILVLGAVAAGVFFLLLAAVRSYTALLATMIIGGLAFSLFDMIPSTLGGDYERQYSKPVMTRMHIGKDGAAAVGTLASGIALWAGASYRTVYVALGLALLLLAVIAFRLPLPSGMPAPARRANEQRQQVPRTLWLVQGVVLAALFVGLISLTEAALEGYSSIYLRDVLESGALLGAVAIAVFQLARMLGQIGSTAAIARFGERGVLIATGVGVGVGVAVLVATQIVALSAVGLLLVGLCAAPISPIAFSLAARSAPDRVGQAVGVVWGAFYVSFLVGPVMVGVLADVASLRGALALFILTALLIPGLAYRKL